MRKNGTPKERLAEVLSVLGVSANSFEEKCGIAHGFVARVTNVITKKNRVKIKTAFPTINIDYIAFGYGNMFSEQEEQPMPSIKERIQQFRKFYDIADTDFCRNTGLAMSFTRKMSDSVRKSSLERIYRAYPMINPTWLEYGKGEMILADKKEKSEKDSVSDRILELIKFLGTTKAAFFAETGYQPDGKENITKRSVDKIVKRFPFISPTWLTHGKGDMIAKEELPMAPFVRKASFGSFIKTGKTKERIPYYKTSEMIGDITAFEWQDNEIVFCRKMNTKVPLPFQKYDFIIVDTEISKRRIVAHEHDMVTFDDGEMVSDKDLRVYAIVMTLLIIR